MHISELKGKKILIAGMAKTGVALAKVLAEAGASVTINDIKSEEEMAQVLEELEGVPLRVELGVHRVETFLDQDLILVSPGVPLIQEAFVAARNKGITVSNDLELAYSLTRTPFIAIAGTNGKTTTTTLIGDIFRKAGKKIIFGGNIGFPLTPMVVSEPDAEFVIAEVSSFQLEVIKTFRPWVGIMLNITPDHLDRYPRWDDYVEAKARVFMNQTSHDFSIINAQDEATPQLLRMKQGSGRNLFFRSQGVVEEGVMMQGKDIIVCLDGRQQLICSPKRIRLSGEHNRRNIVTAALTAWLSHIEAPVIEQVIEEFSGLAHRIEFVAEINGIKFIDDSKGTNVDAVIKAIESLEVPIWLILGGRDKENDYRPLIPLVEEHVKGIFAIGESKDKVSHFFREIVPVYSNNSLKEAVQMGFSLASPGDAVLLSPACASFDMFESYAHRGRVFKHIVKEMELAQGKEF